MSVSFLCMARNWLSAKRCNSDLSPYYPAYHPKQNKPCQ